ncbi:MAG: hypothetical protein GQ533_08435 [Methanosarcinaceae archaeon]|nr:hypothetical protein [Methanosarcinaceae archaeon]
MKTKNKKLLIVFQNKKIKRIWYDSECFHSVSDIISILMDSKNDLTPEEIEIVEGFNEGK